MANELKFIEWDKVTIEEYRGFDISTQDSFWRNASELAKAFIATSFTEKDWNDMLESSRLRKPYTKVFEQWQSDWSSHLKKQLDQITEPL